VILNSAAAITIARPEISFADAIRVAGETIDSGAALAQLERFIEMSR
jgi:anthranilate phosphoribosyltransferase